MALQRGLNAASLWLVSAEGSLQRTLKPRGRAPRNSWNLVILVFSKYLGFGRLVLRSQYIEGNQKMETACATERSPCCSAEALLSVALSDILKYGAQEVQGVSKITCPNMDPKWE